MFLAVPTSTGVVQTITMLEFGLSILVRAYTKLCRSQYRWPKQKVRLMQEVKPFRDRLFVYGIFLDKHNRDYYGMSNESYETVPDYATFGGGIVEAIHIPKQGLALTGLVVDIDPHYWERLDSLEAGYNRIKVITHSREEVYMYVGKE